VDPKKQLPGSVIGGMLLIAGSCIGAGMLALPILTGLAGFFPSMFALFAAWAFMTYTGLLLTEACGWFYGQVNFLSMAKEALGETGRIVGWLTYLFLFYSLLVAYAAASGGIFSAILVDFFGLQLPGSVCSIFFTFVFGWIIYLGTRSVDLLNRLLMAGLILAYLGMICLGVFHIHLNLLSYIDSKYVLASLPVLVISFGFQNMIPSMTAYLKGDLRRVRMTVLGGSLMTLVVYVLWCALVLGIVPVEGPHGIVATYNSPEGKEATSAMSYALGNVKIVSFAQAFAFFAIVTSFLAQGLTLTHFLGDGLKPKGADEASFIQKNKWWLCSLALLPPLILALLVPCLFYKALNFGGGFCAMILFGILPICMVWIGRYKMNKTSLYHVAGGKPALLVALAFTCLVIGYSLVHTFF
jgi:tyrosine-specific transport protein